MKKLNRKGFTLIELLAVITIMAVLMLVAIPAMTRIIENSKRRAFSDTADKYIKAVRNNVLADNIVCEDKDGNVLSASATPAGTYYYNIDTEEPNTTDLMETGGKSPFGGIPIIGYVKWEKDISPATESTTEKIKTTYSIYISDTTNHGFKNETLESDNTMSKIEPSGSNAQKKEKSTLGAGEYVCKLR